MTDRVHSLTVALEHDIRDDDVEPLIQAIRMLRGVLSVTGEVVTSETWMAQERARKQLGEQLIEIVYPKTRR